MELKLESGIPFNPKAIPKPKFKIGQTVYGVKPYYDKVRELEINEITVDVNWVDNNYRSFYKTTISYSVKDPHTYRDDFTEEELFVKKSHAQFQLNVQKEAQKVQLYNNHKEEVQRLERHINGLKQKISDYEQKQG